MSVPQQEMQDPQARSVSLPKRWPLVSQLYRRDPTVPFTKDARLVNAYAERDPGDGKYWVFRRLGVGSTPFQSISGYPQGLYIYQPYSAVISVVNQTVYNSGASIGTISLGGSAQQPCFFELVNSSNMAGAGAQSILIGTVNAYGYGGNGYIYGIANNVFQRITNANFPAATMVPGWGYLDGTTYVMDVNGNIWGSALEDPSTWTGLNVINASSKGDSGVALATQLNYIIALKQWTSQVFYDAGNPSPGSPLSPVPDSQLPFGCLHAYSVQKIDEILFWITSNQTISPQVAMMENLATRIVSNPSVDRVLDNIVFGSSLTATPLYSWSLKHGGHRFYCITSLYLNVSLVYDIDQKLWYQWTDANGNYWPFSYNTFVPPSGTTEGLHLFQAIASNPPFTSMGYIYQVDGDYNFPNDAGQICPLDIYTPNLDFDTIRRKHLNALYFDGDKVPGYLQVRFSDDDYNTWSNFRSVNMNSKKPRLTKCGTFHRRRAYHLRYRGNTTFRIRDMDMQMDIGTL